MYITFVNKIDKNLTELSVSKLEQSFIQAINEYIIPIPISDIAIPFVKKIIAISSTTTTGLWNCGLANPKLYKYIRTEKFDGSIPILTSASINRFLTIYDTNAFIHSNYLTDKHQNDFKHEKLITAGGAKPRKRLS